MPDPRTPNTPDSPTQLVNEIHQILGDVIEDYYTTITETSQDVVDMNRKFVVELISGPGSMNEKLNRLSTMLMWMFLIGREHAIRGLPAPLPKGDAGTDDTVMDDMIADLFRREMGNE